MAEATVGGFGGVGPGGGVSSCGSDGLGVARRSTGNLPGDRAGRGPHPRRGVARDSRPQGGQLPRPASSDRWTGAYLEAAILTDSGSLAGIGGCGGRFLTNAIADYVPTFSYQFDHRTSGVWPTTWSPGGATSSAAGHPTPSMGTAWPRLVASLGPRARLLSLRAGGRSTPITDARLSAQHQCDFWDSLFAPQRSGRPGASLRSTAGSVRR